MPGSEQADLHIIKLTNRLNEVTEGAAQTVQSPGHQDGPLSERIHCLFQSWTKPA